MTCVTRTCGPILVNKTVTGHGLEGVGHGAIADSPQHCFRQGQFLLFQKMPEYNVGDSLGSSQRQHH